ncbi:MAG: DUF3737 family protein [Candidatus Borkfalkiaceae bacterium]|nr:DUF3737 family protein [Christensenellaceae bacterium]
MKNVKRNVIVSAFMAIALCMSVVAGATFALFTSSSSVNIAITSGNVEVTATASALKVYSPKAVNETGIADGDNAVDENGGRFVNGGTATLTGSELKLDNMTPGDKASFEIKVENKSNVTVNFRTKITAGKNNGLYEALILTVDGETVTAGASKWQKISSDDLPNEKIYKCEIELPVAASADYAKKSCELEYKVEATQGNAETSDSSVEIIGLEGTYSDLTAAAIALRESYGINTMTGNFGGHSDELARIDSIQWIISGTVGSGDGNHVVGGGGAILSGGYIYPAIEIDKVVVKGINDAVLVNERVNEPDRDNTFTSGGKTVIYDGITFNEYLSFNSKAQNVTFRNCTFKGGLKVMQAANVTVENCKFEGDGSKDFAFFAQSVPADSMKSVNVANNEISGFMRGMNIQASNDAAVVINGNEISGLTGKTENGFTYGAAIQLTSAKTFELTDNVITDAPVNALHIYAGCPAEKITIIGNVISAKYLCWNAADYDLNKVVSSGNTVSVTVENKCATKTAEIDSAFMLN